MNIGVTGHQKLPDERWPWIRSQVEAILSRHTPHLVAVSSLAEGSDQLFADVALALGAALWAVIPFRGYERTFESPAALDRYRLLIARAKTIEYLEQRSTDEESFMQAGQRVVELSDLVVAIWNGLPAQGLGGTADAVAYANSLGRALVQINPNTGQVNRS